MHMAKKAWSTIDSITISHCWDHTKIQRPPIPPVMLHVSNSKESPSKDAMVPPHNTLSTGWEILSSFALSDMTLPKAEEALDKLYGHDRAHVIFSPALKMVMDAEGDCQPALTALENFCACLEAGATPLPVNLGPVQNERLEAELMEFILELRSWNRIHSNPLKIQELLDPHEEHEIGKDDHIYKGGDAEIIAKVQAKFNKKDPVVEELDDDSDSNDRENFPELLTDDLKAMCAALEKACLHSDFS
jgi:hypothetical protein